jgi:glycosyltransferase involved in cell wall biosynthesis
MLRPDDQKVRDEGGRPLRVCHVAYTFYETDNRVRRYAETLAERGDLVDVLALRRDGQERRGQNNGVRVFRLQRRRVNEGGALSYLVKILLFAVRATALIVVRHIRNPYDVLHVHNVPDFLVFAAWLPKLTGARIILDIHDILPELYADKFRKPRQSWTFRILCWIERKSARFANHVIVASDLWREKLIRRTGLAPDQCTTLLNYPDRRLFKPLPESKRRRNGKFILLYPGTLNHHQGVDIAVEAFALVRERMPNAELHIYGEGPGLPQIAAMVEAIGGNGTIRLRPPVPIEEIALVMADADLGVIPKRAEGFGNEAFSTKSLEFMACGVPIVMARTKVDSHHFDESLVSFFESGDPDSLARAILEDYERPEERLARAARATTFVSDLDWSAKQAAYIRILDAVTPQSAIEPREQVL